MNGTLYLIRHGATEGSDDGPLRYKGSLDVPLSDKGRAQVRAAAEFMLAHQMMPDVLYCSPLSRARESAEIMGNIFGVASKEVPEFKERDFGTWEGMSFDEIRAEFPKAFDSWASDPLHFSPLGGESTLEVRDRVMPRLKSLLNENEDSSLCVVAHGGVNRVILCELTGLPLENIFRLEQHFACVNVIRFYDGLPVGELINASHWI